MVETPCREESTSSSPLTDALSAPRSWTHLLFVRLEIVHSNPLALDPTKSWPSITMAYILGDRWVLFPLLHTLTKDVTCESFSHMTLFSYQIPKGRKHDVKAPPFQPHTCLSIAIVGISLLVVNLFEPFIMQSQISE